MGIKCLNNKNIEEYIKEKYKCIVKLSPNKKELPVESFLQKDFGEKMDCDCTLCAMTMLLNYYNESKSDPYKLYNNICDIAKKYLYSSKNYGSIPIFNKKVLDNVRTITNIIPNKKSYSRYLKDIGYTYNLVKKSIDKGNPVILNLIDDSRHIYTGHTILVIGYEWYTSKIKFFKIYDNWGKEIRYLDYNGLSRISSINYLE